MFLAKVLVGVTCVRRKVRCDTPQTAVAVAWVEPLSIVDAIGARVPCPVEHRRSCCVPCLLQKPALQGEPQPDSFVLYALQALYRGRDVAGPCHGGQKMLDNIFSLQGVHRHVHKQQVRVLPVPVWGVLLGLLRSFAGNTEHLQHICPCLYLRPKQSSLTNGIRVMNVHMLQTHKIAHNVGVSKLC